MTVFARDLLTAGGCKPCSPGKPVSSNMWHIVCMCNIVLAMLYMQECSRIDNVYSIFWGVKKLFEMFSMQNQLCCLSQRDKINAL